MMPAQRQKHRALHYSAIAGAQPLLVRVSEARRLLGCGTVLEELVAEHGLKIFQPGQRGAPGLVGYDDLKRAVDSWKRAHGL